jgi:hypothetical protein
MAELQNFTFFASARRLVRISLRFQSGIILPVTSALRFPKPSCHITERDAVSYEIDLQPVCFVYSDSP